jgi:cob(I)alamin adenosyltransferase
MMSFQVAMNMEGLGRVHIITGPGKGKTTAAFGLAIRAAGHGLKVCVIQFMKTGDTTGEVIAANRIHGVHVVQFGTGRWIDVKNISSDDRAAAESGMKRVGEVLSGRDCDLVVLDEVNSAVAFGLVDLKELLRVLKARRKAIEVVLTGRNAPQELIDYADYVSVIENIKHPYDKGTKARKGIEW